VREHLRLDDDDDLLRAARPDSDHRGRHHRVDRLRPLLQPHGCPHTVRGHGSIESRMWQFIDRACYCPIVYNTLEAYKADLGVK